MSNDREARQKLLTRKLVIPKDYVIIMGCGGSGFNTAMMLGMAGCKKFILIDHDILDESNRNRILSKSSDVDRPKVDILQDLLYTQGADNIICFNEQGTYELLQAISQANKISVIISCVDTFASILMISEFCQDFGIRMVRAGSDDDKISFATQMGCMIDLDGEDGYQIFPNWVGGTMLSAVLAAYLVLYPDIDVHVTTIPVFSQIFSQEESEEQE